MDYVEQEQKNCFHSISCYISCTIQNEFLNCPIHFLQRQISLQQQIYSHTRKIEGFLTFITSIHHGAGTVRATVSLLSDSSPSRGRLFQAHSSDFQEITLPWHNQGLINECLDCVNNYSKTKRRMGCQSKKRKKIKLIAFTFAFQLWGGGGLFHCKLISLL